MLNFPDKRLDHDDAGPDHGSGYSPVTAQPPAPTTGNATIASPMRLSWVAFGPDVEPTKALSDIILLLNEATFPHGIGTFHFSTQPHSPRFDY